MFPQGVIDRTGDAMRVSFPKGPEPAPGDLLVMSSCRHCRRAICRKPNDARWYAANWKMCSATRHEPS